VNDQTTRLGEGDLLLDLFLGARSDNPGPGKKQAQDGTYHFPEVPQLAHQGKPLSSENQANLDAAAAGEAKPFAGDVPAVVGAPEPAPQQPVGWFGRNSTPLALGGLGLTGAPTTAGTSPANGFASPAAAASRFAWFSEESGFPWCASCGTSGKW
jgi:hypothetical protein